MKKLSVIFGILLLTAGSVWSQSIDVPMSIHDDGTIYKPTSTNSFLTVQLDLTTLTVNFSSTAPSQIIIMDEDNHCQVVYAESFAPTTQVIVDLEDEGIGEGRYLLWLFAFGQWWEGEFVVEDENE